MSLIPDSIRASIAVKRQILENQDFIQRIERSIALCIAAYRADGKLLFCGNGGSAADAQHLAAEFSGRFRLDRPALWAEALHANGSHLTAVANDYGYEQIFSRSVEACGRAGDVLFAISTSGNSANILRAAQAALEREMFVVALTGASGGRLAGCCSVLLDVPSDDVPRIQEAHILIGHIICEAVEKELFARGRDIS